MNEFLVFLENMEFSHWVKDAPTIWAFPTILFVHTLGMSIVAGGSAMLEPDCAGFLACRADEAFRAHVPGVVGRVRRKRSDRNHDAGCRRHNQAHDRWISTSRWRLCLRDYSFSSECAGKYSRIRNSIRPRCQATQKCWPGLRWPAGLAQLSPAACWPTSSKQVSGSG